MPETDASYEESPLRELGVATFDESVYRVLLGHHDTTPVELADVLPGAPERVDRALTRLRSLGLVTRLSGRHRRYAAVEPDAAIEALLRERTKKLEEARATIAQLSSIFHSIQRWDGRGGTIEVLDSPAELGRWFVRLQHEVREEMLVLDRPPYALGSVNPVEPVSLAQGVRWRAVYAPESVELDGAWREIEELAARGEQGRVLPGLPHKLAIADRSIALMPLDLSLVNTKSVLIRESTLLDALISLFESYWQRAVPIGASTPDPTAAVNAEDGMLVHLLASGLTDTAIARQLGLSTRTVRRRLRALFEELPASNRFQAGVQAARRGWL